MKIVVAQEKAERQSSGSGLCTRRWSGRPGSGVIIGVHHYNILNYQQIKYNLAVSDKSTEKARRKAVTDAESQQQVC
jgi:hypothetical protein